MGSSESSDDEQKLKQAIDYDFITRYNKSQTQTEYKPQSLRNQISTDSNHKIYLLNITPECRNFIGNHLEQLLEKYLNKHLVSTFKSYENHSSDDTNGIRLFSNSKHCIDLNESVECVIGNRKNNKCDSSGEDEDLTRFATVAVDPERILSKSEIQYWQPKNEKKVYKYKKGLKNNQFVLESID